MLITTISKQRKNALDAIKRSLINTRKGWENIRKERGLDFNHLISYIYSMKGNMKKITITSKNITPKQWSLLLLELNLVRKAWRPYAKLDLSAHGLKKTLKLGMRKHGDSHVM